VLALALAVFGCRFEPATVTRLASGVPVDGRYVPPEAYAAYARGSLLEARGDVPGALAAYESALDEDPDSPEILARIGAMQCRLSQRAGDGWAHAARQSFSRALAIDPEVSAAWLERARCAEQGNRLDEALGAAARAAALDPASNEAALLVIDVAEESGKIELARVWLDSLAVALPVSRTTWLRLAAFAARHRDAGRLLRARRGLRASRGGEPPELLLDESLSTGNLEQARHAAIALRLPPGRLAIRAALVGALEVARAQSELVLRADPDDSDAWAAALLVASLEPGAPRLSALLARPPEDPTPLGPEALAVLTEIVARVAGADAKAALQSVTR
jgi:tetratricopeptide (TPR) repeat protein